MNKGNLSRSSSSLSSSRAAAKQCLFFRVQPHLEAGRDVEAILWCCPALGFNAVMCLSVCSLTLQPIRPLEGVIKIENRNHFPALDASCQGEIAAWGCGRPKKKHQYMMDWRSWGRCREIGSLSAMSTSLGELPTSSKYISSLGWNIAKVPESSNSEYPPKATSSRSTNATQLELIHMSFGMRSSPEMLMPLPNHPEGVEGRRKIECGIDSRSFVHNLVCVLR